MNENNYINIASVSSCIAGDYRYSQRMNVSLDFDAKKVKIVVEDSAPAGGMDTRGSSIMWRTELTRTADFTTPAKLVAFIKDTLKFKEADVIKTYGKPTKNFTWFQINDMGLSSSIATKALREVTGI